MWIVVIVARRFIHLRRWRARAQRPTVGREQDELAARSKPTVQVFGFVGAERPRRPRDDDRARGVRRSRQRQQIERPAPLLGGRQKLFDDQKQGAGAARIGEKSRGALQQRVSTLMAREACQQNRENEKGSGRQR